MRKVRFALFLPVVQVMIAALLTQWADRNSWILRGETGHPIPSHLKLFLYPWTKLAWEVCRGINAPAMTFKGLAVLHLSEMWRQPSFSLFGFFEEEIWFLVGVGVVWYLVGRMVDRRRTSSKTLNSTLTTGETVSNLLLLGFGIFLLIAEVLAFSNENHAGAVWFYPFYEGVFWILLSLWSVILVIFPGIALARGVLRRSVN